MQERSCNGTVYIRSRVARVTPSLADVFTQVYTYNAAPFGTVIMIFIRAVHGSMTYCYDPWTGSPVLWFICFLKENIWDNCHIDWTFKPQPLWVVHWGPFLKSARIHCNAMSKGHMQSLDQQPISPNLQHLHDATYTSFYCVRKRSKSSTKDGSVLMPMTPSKFREIGYRTNLGHQTLCWWIVQTGYWPEKIK